MPNTHGPKLNRDWIGLRVTLLKNVANSYYKVPMGTTGSVDSYSAGQSRIGVTFDACSSCGIQPRVAGFKRIDLGILTPEWEWPNTQGTQRRKC